MANEKKTDILIARLLREAGIDTEPNGSRIKEVQEALAASSKRCTGKQGFPEFTAQVGEFIIVIEDKAENERKAKYISCQEIITTVCHNSDYSIISVSTVSLGKIDSIYNKPSLEGILK